MERIQRFSDNKLTVLHMRTLDDNEPFEDRRTEFHVSVVVEGDGRMVTVGYGRFTP